MNFSSSLHSNFFSSLKRVEKRLKLEHTHQQNPTAATQSSSSSLSTPLYILPSQQQQQPIIDGGTDSSEPPQAFLHSLSSHTQQPNSTPEQEKHPLHNDDGHGDDDDDSITVLLQLLGLSLSSDDDEYNDSRYNVCENGVVGFDGKDIRNNGSKCKRGDLLESVSDMDNRSDVCECGNGFYEKIVGVKGPKCKEEVKRLEGWIDYFMNERIESLRLAHLLLGKAAFESKGRDCGHGGLDFPSTIQEFLQMDPPNITR